MHAIYLLLNLCFNSNIKFKFKLYSNYIKIVILLFTIYLLTGIIYPKSISMIQLTTYFKVKYESILIGYYKSHGVGIRVI